MVSCARAPQLSRGVMRTDREMEILRPALVALVVATSCACSQPTEQEVAPSIAQSHVDANVPPSIDLDRFLRRDLEAYFGSTDDKVAVQYKLLRDGPTQTGAAYPKFYVWVEVKHGDGSSQQGAVRLAAIERKTFEVTDFVAETDIRTRRVDIYRVFPGPVCEAIKSRLGI